MRFIYSGFVIAVFTGTKAKERILSQKKLSRYAAENINDPKGGQPFGANKIRLYNRER